MGGRGRGREELNPELESAYQEYLRQCREAGEQQSRSSATSGYGSAGNIVSPFFAGRGRGRGILSPPPRPSSTSPSTSSSSNENAASGVKSYQARHDIKEEALASLFQDISIGRGRSRGIAIRPQSSGIDLPLPTLAGTSRGRGSSPLNLNLKPGFPAAEAVASTQAEVGVEDYAHVEKEVVVKRGEKGNMIPLTVNYIRLSVTQGRGIFEYHVDFEPLLESVRSRRYIMRSVEDVLGKVRTFDGAKLYLPFKLPEKNTVLIAPHPNDMTREVAITIRFLRENRIQACIHFYNVLFRRIMEKLGMQEVNRNFYDYRSRYRLPQHRMEIWPGYVTAVDEVEDGLMLCIDASHRVLRTSTMLDVFNDMSSENRDNFERLKQLYADYAISQIVLTRYNNRNYRVDDVAWNLNPKSTFQLANGEIISYVDYYKSQYDVTVTDLEQPLLVHRPRPTRDPNPGRKRLGLVCLIPECCFMTGLTAELTKNHKVMKDVAQFTSVTPNQRRVALIEYVKNIKQNPEAAGILKGWGLEMEDTGIDLDGRRLAPPNIIINSKYALSQKTEFSSEVSHNPCLEPVPVKDWMIFCTSIDKSRADLFMQTYRTVCRSIGIEIRTDAVVVAIQGNPRRLIENYMRAIMENLRKDFVIVLVPSEIAELYEAIKRVFCLERPIPSQVILSKTLGRQHQIRQIVSKIALQINCKLGGALWTIRIPLGEKIMFVGMDVYHDPRKRNNSVLALVASINEAQTKYFSRIVTQRAHQEVGDSLRGIFTDCLHSFRQHTGGWPDRIVVFRDGVGDGQLELTREIEINQMMSVIRMLYDTEIPKFTFTIVQKRISSRLFALDPATNTYVNPPAGTVLDHTVTRRFLFDFFLVSQLVAQGTVSPTHYIVLEDTAETRPDLIQKFAFATSYLYYNWAGPIRVPAVCQYAHKLAFLVGQYLKEAPSDKLSTQLYYL